MEKFGKLMKNCARQGKIQLFFKCLHHTFYFHFHFSKDKAGVPLTDYKRSGGSAVSGAIWWNLLRLFPTDRFDPTARPSDQISHWQSKITSDRQTKFWHGRLPLITSDYYFPLTQVLPLPDFSSNFSSDPPISRAMGHRLQVREKLGKLTS